MLNSEASLLTATKRIPKPNFILHSVYKCVKWQAGRYGKPAAELLRVKSVTFSKKVKKKVKLTGRGGPQGCET
jgi:hypothetical protein